MSISGALASALTGLTASARGAEVVSTNIANATNETYGRRALEISAGIAGDRGTGARIDGVRRLADPVLLADRRAAGSAASGAGAEAAFFQRLEREIGLPGEAGALTDRIAGFEAALVTAASRPDSTARLADVAAAANALAERMNGLTDVLQQERMRADRAIDAAVATLNETLERVGHLNDRIARLDAGGQDSSALIDQRQGLIDDISDLVPVREVARDNGRVALFTPGGAILLDHRPAEIGFTPAGIIVPEMSLASGALSAVAVNGHSQAPGALDGGRLAALFAIRDTHAPAEQARLDGLARDLTERLAAPGIDPTLGPGDAALFTDAGAAFDPANEAGFAGRIALASAVDPGGAGVWRLRDGLGAAAPGNPGDASLLHALHDALSNLRTPASGGFPPEARTAAGLAADLTSNVARARLGQEAAQAFAGAEFEAIREIELRRGVDTDAELQTLLEIEKAYAANARVVATVDEMLNTLLGL